MNSEAAGQTGTSPTAATAVPAERTPLIAWWVAVLMLLYSILSVADRTVITVLVSPIQKDLGLTDFQTSLLLGPAFAVSYAIGTVPLSWAADRFPRRAVVGLSVAGWSVATAASGLARSFLHLFGCRVGVGLCEAGVMPAAYALLAEKFPKRRLTTAMAIVGSGPKLGASAAFGISALLFAYSPPSGRIDLPVLGSVATWEAVFLLLGVFGIAVAPLCLTFSEQRRRRTEAKAAQSSPGLASFLKTRWNPVLPIILGFSLVGVGAAALSAWVPTYMTRTYGWGPAEYGPVLSLMTLATATTVIFKGLIVDWLFGRGMLDAHIRFFTWLLAAAIPIMFFAFASNQPMHFLILYAVANIAAMTFLVYLLSILQLITPSEIHGRITGLTLLSITTGASGIAPTVVATLTDFVFRDPGSLGKSLAIVTLTSFVLALIILRMSMRPVREILSQKKSGDELKVGPSATLEQSALKPSQQTI
jgi:MFS family permease